MKSKIDPPSWKNGVYEKSNNSEGERIDSTTSEFLFVVKTFLILNVKISKKPLETT